MQRHVRHSVLLALATVLLAPLPGCDRNDGAPPPIVIVTPAPVRGVIAETSFTGYEAGLWISVPIQISDRGKLDVTVDWTHDDTWMYVYLGDAECDYVALTGGSCPFFIESETRDPKPRVIESDILEPATYYIYLYNVPYDPDTGIGSDNREAVQIVVGLTVGFNSDGAEDQPVRLGRPTVVAPPQL
jgi:hypothetical protein